MIIIDRMSRVEQLRNRYPEFTYTSATHILTANGLQLVYSYQVGSIAYSHTVFLQGVTEQNLENVSSTDLQDLVCHIGLIEAFSYWKATCSPCISVVAFKISPQQALWWHTVLVKGMGEYFFVNQIDFTQENFVQIVSKNSGSTTFSKHPRTIPNVTTGTKILIPVGGGKDSIVSLELLTNSYDAKLLGCLLVNPTQAALDSAKLSGISVSHVVDRQFDPKLSRFTQEQGLNGHVPVSASFAWISLLIARLFKYDLIALSNEASSNEGSVEYKGHMVNHQYSKTYEFELALQKYVRDWLSPSSPWYFSLLRPLHELQIAKVFAEHTRYHSVFRSCNRGQKTNSWCGKCPKCLFAYLILSPFISQERLIEIFGSAVLNSQALWPELQQLLGIVPQKPLECVGTRAECLAAVHLTTKKLSAENKPLPSLIQRVQSEPSMQHHNLNILSQDILTGWNEHHSVPDELATILKQRVQLVQT